MKMKKEKEFDCLKLKDEIQSQILREHRGMSSQEVGEYIQKKLEKSDSAVARLWRVIQKKPDAPNRKSQETQPVAN